MYHRIVVFIVCISIFLLSPMQLVSRAVGIDEPGEQGQKGVEPLAVGNFLLPTTQEPGPLFGFGQNIINKRDLQIYCSPNKLRGHNFSASELNLYALYGITDTLSIFLAMPVALRRTAKGTVTSISSLVPLRNGHEVIRMNNFDIDAMMDSDNDDDDNDDTTEAHSSGLEDTILQVEYAYYDKRTLKGEFQATIVGNIVLPTGSTKKNPRTGFGSPAFFLGTTTTYQALFWYVYGSVGGLITTKKNGRKFGNTLLYQLGFEGIIGTLPQKWIFAWIFELFGIRTQKNIVMNQPDPNSGSHILFGAPSLWISSKHFVFQIGIGVPVYQKLTGIQNKTSYFLNTNIAWTFNLQ